MKVYRTIGPLVFYYSAHNDRYCRSITFSVGGCMATMGYIVLNSELNGSHMVGLVNFITLSEHGVYFRKTSI